MIDEYSSFDQKFFFEYCERSGLRSSSILKNESSRKLFYNLFILSGLKNKNFLKALEYVDKYMAICAKPLGKAMIDEKAFNKEIDSLPSYFYPLVKASFYGVEAISTEAYSVSRCQMAIALLAVERFRLKNGRLPDSLSELVPDFMPSIPTDPFDGKPIRY